MSSEDDERLDRLRDAMGRFRERHEQDVIAAAEQRLSEVSAGDCPPPLACHPFYRGMPWLVDWLNG